MSFIFLSFFLSFIPFCKLVLDQIEGFFNTEIFSSSSGGFSATKTTTRNSNNHKVALLATNTSCLFGNNPNT
jgi:hypothetical protein